MFQRVSSVVRRWLQHFCKQPVQGFRPGSTMGNWGEDCAVDYLRAQHCKILGRNIRPLPRLELDIIARDRKGVTLFVEVKTRAKETEWSGRPLDAIDRKKRFRMRRAALHWLTQQQLLTMRAPYRFDAIEVIGTPNSAPPKIRWVQQLDMSSVRRVGDDW